MGRGIAIPNLRPRHWKWGWVSAPRPGRFTPSKDPVPIVQEAGWAPGPFWSGAENLAFTGIRSPDRPARSESLYRLSYPGRRITLVTTAEWRWRSILTPTAWLKVQELEKNRKQSSTNLDNDDLHGPKWDIGTGEVKNELSNIQTGIKLLNTFGGIRQRYYRVLHRQCKFNVILSRVRVTSVSVVKQKLLHTLSVCL